MAAANITASSAQPAIACAETALLAWASLLTRPARRLACTISTTASVTSAVNTICLIKPYPFVTDLQPIPQRP